MIVSYEGGYLLTGTVEIREDQILYSYAIVIAITETFLSIHVI